MLTNSKTEKNINVPAMPQFRSVLPHEPLPLPNRLPKDDGNRSGVDSFGYVHIQGALLPKIRDAREEKDEADGRDQVAVEDAKSMTQLEVGNDQVKEMLVRALQVDDTYLPHDSVLRQLPISFRSLISVELIQDGKSDCNDRDEDSSNKAIVPSNANANAGSDCANGSTMKKQKGRTNHVAITKARIQYPSAKVARAVVAFIRHQKISPSILFPQFHQGGDSAAHPYVYVYSTKHIQATQVTQIPLPPPTLAWPRVGMPKFRRLLLNSHDAGDAIQKIKYERSHTRFVFMTNIIDYSLSSKAESEPIHVPDNSGNRNIDVDAATVGDRVDVSSDIIERLRTEPYLFQDAIRNAIAPYLVDLGLEADVDGNADAKMLPPEVFVPSKKQQSPFKYCYIGTRSAQHAQALIRDLQGKKITLAIARGNINNKQSDDAIIVTGKLFLDFVDITQRSAAKSNRLNPSSVLPGFNDLTDVKGGPPKPECTSTTNSIVVQGLHCLADFVTAQEEQVLLACLTGPHAPWAPSQKNFSKTGSVKRRVQHYGYVFDYETADVLRDRDTTATTDDGSKSNALCPPMPVLPDGSEAWSDTQMNEFVSEAVRDGNGWDVVAAVIERVRRHDFNLAIGSNVDGEINDANADTIKEIVNTAEKHTSVNLKSEFVSDIDKRNAALPSDASKCYPNINQMTVNEYKRGQGIGSHIDTKSAFDDGLISLSLGSDCVMEFRNEKNPKEKKLVHLPPRSLLLMSGPARYSWAHQIVTRMTDCVDGKVIPRKTRVSLTLRTAITLPCQGDDGVKPLEKVESRDYPPKWGKLNGNAKDSNNSDDMDGNPDDDIATPETEKNHVQAVYDAIATQWHHTRGKRGVLWPGATQFLKTLPKCSIVADVGCGDGKYFPAIWEAGSYVIGTDISEPLLQTSVGACSWAGSRTGPENRQIRTANLGLNERPAVAVADCMHIPLKDKSCDAAICIAVMHHLSTAPRRRRCLQELSRIVKVGGKINVQAWALEQDKGSRRKFAGTDVFVPFNAQPRYLDKIEKSTSQSKTSEAGNDECKGVAEMYSDAYDGAEYDEQKGLVVFQRYCHMYKEGELNDLVSMIDTLEIEASGFESGNHFLILKVVK